MHGAASWCPPPGEQALELRAWHVGYFPRSQNNSKAPAFSTICCGSRQHHAHAHDENATHNGHPVKDFLRQRLGDRGLDEGRLPGAHLRAGHIISCRNKGHRSPARGRRRVCLVRVAPPALRRAQAQLTRLRKRAKRTVTHEAAHATQRPGRARWGCCGAHGQQDQKEGGAAHHADDRRTVSPVSADRRVRLVTHAPSVGRICCCPCVGSERCGRRRSILLQSLLLQKLERGVLTRFTPI